MKPKNPILLKISWYTGIIAFLGGWAIFIIWAASRYLGALDFKSLEFFGFSWMVSFFWLCLIALLLLFIYILINRRNLHIKMALTAFIILANIPSVLLILPLHGDIDNKVFVKFKNHSGKDVNLKLNGDFKAWSLGSIKDGAYSVINYDPPYANFDGRHYQNPDTLNLIITHNSTVDTIGFPTLRMGTCKHLILDKNLTIKQPTN